MIVVVGANGQLGLTLKQIKPEWHYIDRQQLNLLMTSEIANFFKKKPDVIVNCAAYTKVDLAEENKVEAYAINAEAVSELAKSCRSLIQISTDYVFNGQKNAPYLETDPCDPINYYGSTKLVGEQNALKYNQHSIVIRTSWLYSAYNVNYVKRMIELSQTRDQLKIVNDQFGSPTYALDLARVIVRIAESKSSIAKGIYHYSNEGMCSWFDFTKEIFKIKNIAIPVLPISSSEFKTPAKRPQYSVLDKTKIKTALNIEIPLWQAALREFLNEY